MDFPTLISGGQAGADRAALDWAIANGITHGGWCPCGRLAEDGVIAEKYDLRETPEAAYSQRTEWNVRDSDATVIVSRAARLTGGSLFTMELTAAQRKPCLHLSGLLDAPENTRQLCDFIRRHGVKILNVAGPRASGEPQVGAFVHAILDELLANWE